MTRVSTSFLIRILFAATVALCSAAAVHAGAPARTLDPPPVKVSFSDLNLDTPAGVKALYGRINTAAAQACGPRLAMWYPGKPRAAEQCDDETVDQTVKQINRPALSALHAHTLNLASR